MPRALSSLKKNLFWLSLLNFTFVFKSANDLLSLYHFLKLSNVLRELCELQIFSVSYLNIFKVDLFFIFRHLILHKVLRHLLFVSLLKFFYFYRVLTEFLELRLDLLVKFIRIFYQVVLKGGRLALHKFDVLEKCRQSV